MPRFDDEAPVARWIELVHLDVDGEAGPAERAELQAHLAASHEARALHSALEDLTARLDTLADAPAAFPVRDDVMAALRRPRLIAREPRPRRRMIFALAAALAAIIIALAAMFSHSLRPSDTAATMAPLEAARWPVENRIDSTLIVRRHGDLYALEPLVAVTSEITIEWDATKLAIAGIFPATAETTQTHDSVTFQHPQRNFGIVLQSREPGTHTARVRVSTGKHQLFDAALVFESMSSSTRR